MYTFYLVTASCIHAANNLDEKDVSLTVSGKDVPIHVNPEIAARPLKAPGRFFRQQFERDITSQSRERMDQHIPPKTLGEYISLLRHIYHHDFAEEIETAVALNV